MSMKPIVQKHSMDIPHVTAVELPFIVKNEDKAIEMLGGKTKISKVINTSHNPVSTSAGFSQNGNDITNNLLELRLRDDPFHHPIQSSQNTCEKVLLKISIPKKNLPSDYKANPMRYTVKDLVSKSDNYTVQPIAIIDNTYSFKSMADFQVSTKNNPVIQEFNKSVINGKNYREVNRYFEAHDKFNAMPDYQSKENFRNIDHQLPPPPLFSPIQFPFDYKYQKNPLTATFKDSESGEVKMISKKSTPKLHTIIVDFHNNNIPQEPANTLKENLQTLKAKNLPINSLDYSLLECINWLQKMFDIKPIWTRKHLEDIVPGELRRVIKQALPYVSFIYKSGPWRFCNVKLGVDPKKSKDFWIYQSEYFRIPGLRFSKKNFTATAKIKPPTLLANNSNIEISNNLFFDGVRLPRTITYQVGDLLDADIRGLIEERSSDSFLRDKPDFQDGWINKQSMECIRRIIRYKLIKLVKEEPIDPVKIMKIISTDYTRNDDDDMEVDEPVALEDEEEEDDDDDDDEDEDVENYKDDETIDEEALINKLKTSSELNELSKLTGFIKQDSLRNL